MSVYENQTGDENEAVNTTGGGFGSQKDFHSTEIIGPVNRYTSGYWALSIPALMGRYLYRAAAALIQGSKNPSENRIINFFSKIGFTDKFPNLSAKLADNIYPIAVGLWMGFITTKYADRNAHDIKHLTSEALAYEFDKDPKDVGLKDFANSKNDIVVKIRKNYVKQNFWRYGIVSLFFSAFAMPKKIYDGFTKSGADTVDLGVSAFGIHLYDNVNNRTATFFEMAQQIVDQKINHSNIRGEILTPQDIMNLYDRRRRANEDAYTAPRMNSEKWANDFKVASKISHLMNQTYDNVKITEQANLTIPKLFYLWGHKLLDSENFVQDMAFVDLANKSKDMKEVKQVANDLKNGVKLEEAFAKFGIDVSQYKTIKQDEELAAASTQKIWQQAIKNPVEDQGLASDLATSNFMKNIKQKAALTPPPPSYIGKESARPETATGQTV